MLGVVHVGEVRAAHAKGTSRILANVLAINVFPVPVGPLKTSVKLTFHEL
jgi:hypothetical protein